MSLFAKWAPKLGGRAPLPPRVFSRPFEKIKAETKVEEENLPHYTPARYYPVRIGEVFASRYQVVGKLGQHGHVVIKVFTRENGMPASFHPEIDIYQKIGTASASSSHPGRYAIRSVLDSVQVAGPDGEHHCLVHPPLWQTSQNVLLGNPAARFPPMIMATLLRRVFLALDFLHTECRLVHTDIKADNIVFSLDRNDPVLETFEQDEIEHPSPRKETSDGRFIYLSRDIGRPQSLGYPVLCDFGAAQPGDRINESDVQPDAYRSSEMILRLPWAYKVDIWNVGCMVWDLCQGGHIFQFRNTEDHLYDSKYHMASIISLIGPPPRDLVERCSEAVKKKYFNEKGEFDCGVPLPAARSWESIETTLEKGEDRDAFLRLMKKMIEWVPEKRSSAAELLEDEWINAHRSDRKR